ncbi:unnamed protein product [Moneuplotes crassus]|uniref:Uncharacterized protein n=1 Tax=Euplotes crassus TaxID=5936 RepID=A0AAD1U9S4_EUPCR|nr:unnamed protein product [Moneuplotes crassus]
MLREPNPDFEILGTNAAKVPRRTQEQQISAKNIDPLRGSKEYPQPDNSFNQSYVEPQSRKSIVNNSYNQALEDSPSRGNETNYVQSFNMIDINQSTDYNDYDTLSPDSQARHTSLFGQKYPFSTRNQANNVSKISRKNLFNPGATISLEQSFKQRDDIIQKIKEENKKHSSNLIDPPSIKRNEGKVPKLATHKPQGSSRVVLSKYLNSMNSADYFPKEKNLKTDYRLSPQNKLPQIRAFLNPNFKRPQKRTKSKTQCQSVWSCYRKSPVASNSRSRDTEIIGGNNLYSIQKKVIDDRSGTNIYVKENQSIPDKINKAIMPLIQSLQQANDKTHDQAQPSISLKTLKPDARLCGIKRYTKAELRKKRGKMGKNRAKTIERFQVPKFSTTGSERQHKNGFKIDFEHWYRVMGLTEDKVSPKEKRKREFLKFLSGLNELETRLYWKSKSKEIEETYSLENIQKIADEKWRKVKPTWRNTAAADKIHFFAMVDQEQEKAV